MALGAAGRGHAPRWVPATPCGPRGPPGPQRPRPARHPAAGPQPRPGGAGSGWLVAAVEKQRDEVTLKRDQKERLKEAEKEWRREAVGRKPALNAGGGRVRADKG